MAARVLEVSDIKSLPHFIKAKTITQEFHSACPFCGGTPSPQKVAEGRGNEPADRFISWPITTGQLRYYCRGCKQRGFTGSPSEEEIIQYTKMAKDTEAEEFHKAQAHKKQAIEAMNKAGLAQKFHDDLNGHTPHLASRWGLEEYTIREFRVGYCNVCPMFKTSDSYTLPYLWGETVINIRHRLLQPNGADKYRPHARGLGNALFNANILKDAEVDSVCLFEGEFKTLVLWQNGFYSVAIPGVTAFQEPWVQHFEELKRVYVVMDPGEIEKSMAYKYAGWLSKVVKEVRVVNLFAKPDDMFTRYGADSSQFSKMLAQGRRVQ